MIEQYYKDFKVRDYMDDNSLKEQVTGNLIDCSLGTNAFIDESIIKKYILNSNYEINKYPLTEYKKKKKELLRYWGKYMDSNLRECNIAFGAGVMGILRNISEFLITNKTKILGCAPQFPRFISEVELKKGKYEYYDFGKEENFKFNVENFIKCITNEYDVIHLENPNNPTGQIISIMDIKKIVEKAKEYNIIVLLDEAYGDYMEPNNSGITLVDEYDNLVVLRSASKYYGLPNHRVGYIFANENFVKVYNEISIPFPFSDLSANVFRNILKNQNEIDYTKEKVKEINKKIYEAIGNNYYLYTDISTPIFTMKSYKYNNLSVELRKKGIIAENCSAFLGLDSSFARLRVPKEWNELLKVIKTLI